jgi:2-methylisocitrate lyase-like PEP mutase family enzyme
MRPHAEPPRDPHQGNDQQAESRERCASSRDFRIVARTDARTSLGIDAAIRRGEAYAKAGADIIFIESRESESEMRKIGSALDVPLVSNQLHGGRTPILRQDKLREIGYRMAIYSTAGLLAATCVPSEKVPGQELQNEPCDLAYVAVRPRAT